MLRPRAAHDVTADSQPVRSARLPDRNPGYVGPQVCAECHRERVAGFQATNHFRTCRPPRGPELPSGFAPGRGTFVPRFPGVRFEMGRSGDAVTQTVIRTTPLGEQRTSTRIDLVLGAGTADDVYLAWHDDDRMYELPIAWLWPRETWGASHFCHPWAEGDFSRAMTVRCLECHNTWIEYVPGMTNQYRRSGAILGVTCERCHGPGREHVAYHRSHPGDDVAHAILHPAGLDRERLIEVCTQCHSNAVTHRRAPFSYRPGEPLDDYFRTLAIERPESDHVANQIQGLRNSLCFQRSATMTCITCHDPHRAEAADAFPAKSCLQCHDQSQCGEQEQLPVAVRDECIGCHMPQRIKINVKFELEQDNFVPPIRRYQHRIAIDPVARDEVLLAWRRTQSDADSHAEADRLAAALVSHWTAQAGEHRRQYRFLAAIADVREALAVDDAAPTSEMLRELVQIQTRLYDDWARALHEITEDRPAEAAETLQGILRIKPDDAEAHSKLGTIHAMLGQEQQAIPHLQAVAVHDPDNPSGFGILGKLAFQQGRWRDALDYWSRAAEIEPFHAQIQFDIGQALAGLEDLSQAIEHLQRAHEIDPTRTDILAALLGALERAGRLDEAVEAASRAYEQAPLDDVALRIALRERLDALRTRSAQGVQPRPLTR
jgi:tetratricopeptide (TPR) repeat protein